MREIILALLICLAFLNSDAQGIAGRRISAEFEFDYTMKFFSPTEKAFSIGGKFRGGYVISTRWQLYAGINYYELNYLQNVFDTTGGYSYSELLGDATDNIACTEFDITARHFLKAFGKRNYDCIAPDGKYIELSVITTKTVYNPGELHYYWDEPLLPEVRSMRLSFGIGNQQVWWNRVIANTGILFSLPVYKITPYGPDNAPYMQWQKGHNFFRGYMSIGVLL